MDVAYRGICDLETLKRRKKLKKTEGVTTLLVVFHEGEVYALNDKCPHRKASLYKGALKDGVVKCPHHGAEIDIKTGAIQAKPKVAFFRVPAKPAATYAVKLQDGRVFVDL